MRASTSVQGRLARRSHAALAALALLALLTLLLVAPAVAQEPAPPEGGDAAPIDLTGEDAGPEWKRMSAFEWRQVQRALDKHGLTLLEPSAAEGRTIEEIIVETEEVFTDEDPWPNLFNIFHVTSKDYVIAREVLLQPGDAYVHARINESERNLRALGAALLSVALVIPVEGSAPDQVKLLVVAKDIWSLRLSWNALFVGDTLTFLAMSLNETNLFGLHKQVALTTLLEQDTFSVGERYLDPRLLGSRLQLGEEVSVKFNRETGVVEGYEGAVSFGRPLFSLSTKWGWNLSASGVTEIGRFYEGRQVRRYDNPDTEAIVEELPYHWRTRVGSLATSVTRSFGLDIKQNVTLGYRLSFQEFEWGERDSQLEDADPVTVASFEERVLPRTETISGPTASYQVFMADFVVLRNFETFALAEDFRLGPSLAVSASHSEPQLGSTFRFQRMSGSLIYRWLFGDKEDNPSRKGDLLAASVGYETRYQESEFQDNETTFAIRNYTPVFWHGRVATRVLMIHRFRDRSNQQTTLGGGTGLRGYPSGAFLGRSLTRGNLEWRTLPIELYTFQLGLVAFYDVGGVADDSSLSDLALYHGVGIGGRVVNPTTDKVVMRFDYGFPLNPPAGIGVFPGSFEFGFEQAF